MNKFVSFEESNVVYPTLYKRSTTGKISTWYVEVKGNKFRTVSGFIDGQKVTSEWTTCEGKNVGKKNSTTPEQQAISEALSMIDKRKSIDSYFENINDIDNKKHFKPMLAHDFKDYENEIKFPIFSQPKLDGVRCITKKDGMWSRNGKPIISAPHIFESLKEVFELHPDLILDGELFAERSVTDFNTIISCVRKTKPKKEDLEESKKYIQYWIYDLPSSKESFNGRFSKLCNLKKILPKTCIITPTYILSEKKQIYERYSAYIQQEFEGQILRTDSKYENKRTKNLLKHKSFIDEEFIIKGYVEGKGNLQGKMGKLVFEKDGEEFRSAVNGTWEYLEELWENRYYLIGKKATVKYFELTEKGVPRFSKVINIDRESYE